MATIGSNKLKSIKVNNRLPRKSTINGDTIYSVNIRQDLNDCVTGTKNNLTNGGKYIVFYNNTAQSVHQLVKDNYQLGIEKIYFMIYLTKTNSSVTLYFHKRGANYKNSSEVDMYIDVRYTDNRNMRVDIVDRGATSTSVTYNIDWSSQIKQVFFIEYDTSVEKFKLKRANYSGDDSNPISGDVTTVYTFNNVRYTDYLTCTIVTDTKLYLSDVGELDLK